MFFFSLFIWIDFYVVRNRGQDLLFSFSCSGEVILDLGADLFLSFLLECSWFIMWCWFLPEKAMAPHSSTLAWKVPWTEAPGGLQSMGLWRVGRLSDFTFTFHSHALEKEMATHSSVLAWRLPGTREPGGLPSLGSHRVGHDWSDSAAAVGFCWTAKWISYIYTYIHSFLDSFPIRPL